MRAVRLQETGDPGVLRLEDIHIPDPREGQVLVRIAAAGVNFIDTYHRRGLYALHLPATLGVEGSGVVEMVGSGVEGVGVGDRVAYVNQLGSYAEKALVSAASLVVVPPEIDLVEAAAVMLQGCTPITSPAAPSGCRRAIPCSSMQPPAGLGTCSCSSRSGTVPA